MYSELEQDYQDIYIDKCIRIYEIEWQRQMWQFGVFWECCYLLHDVTDFFIFQQTSTDEVGKELICYLQVPFDEIPFLLDSLFNDNIIWLDMYNLLHTLNGSFF